MGSDDNFSFSIKVSPYGSFWTRLDQGPTQMRLLSLRGDVLAILTR